jgi:hypothetical protein
MCPHQRSISAVLAERWAVSAAVTTIRNVDTVIGGHTPSPVTWNDFKTYVDFYADFFSSARSSMKKGASLDDFVKTYRVPDKFKGFVADPARVRANAEAIYNESKGTR